MNHVREHSLRLNVPPDRGALFRLLNKLRGHLANLAGTAALRRDLADARVEAAMSREWLRLTEELAQVGHWRIQFPGYEVHWSDEIFRIHGLDANTFQPDIENALAAFHPADRAMVEQRVAATVADGAPYEIEARIVRRDGEIRHILSRGSLQRRADGEPTALIGVFIDISRQKLVEADLRETNKAKKQANEALRVLAFADGLTGLRNRRCFDDSFIAEFTRAVQDGTTLGLIMVDLDHFKAFNDLYGHPAGDACLQKVAAAIAAVPARPGDLVARYGGEEIVLLLPGIDSSGLAAMADRVVRAVRALNLPHLGSPHGRVTISCGTALRPAADTALQPLDLLRHADRALYHAKHKGRDGACPSVVSQPDPARLSFASH